MNLVRRVRELFVPGDAPCACGLPHEGEAFPLSGKDSFICFACVSRAASTRPVSVGRVDGLACSACDGSTKADLHPVDARRSLCARCLEKMQAGVAAHDAYVADRDNPTPRRRLERRVVRVLYGVLLSSFALAIAGKEGWIPALHDDFGYFAIAGFSLLGVLQVRRHVQSHSAEGPMRWTRASVVAGFALVAVTQVLDVSGAEPHRYFNAGFAMLCGVLVLGLLADLADARNEPIGSIGRASVASGAAALGMLGLLVGADGVIPDELWLPGFVATLITMLIAGAGWAMTRDRMANQAVTDATLIDPVR